MANKKGKVLGIGLIGSDRMAQRWRLGTVTPAVGPWSEQNYPTPIEPEQHYRQAVRWLLYCPWPVVLGFRSAGLILLVQ